MAIALDHLDMLYVLDGDDKKVTVFTPNGAMVAKFGGDTVFDKPVGIAVTESEIFVLDKATPEIKVFTKDGKFFAQIHRARQPGGGSVRPHLARHPGRDRVDSDGHGQQVRRRP